MSQELRHCCTLDAAGKGILIEGISGAGKTSLMLGLVERLQRLEISAAVVSDDQTILTLTDGRLAATAPETIQGRVELRGYGIVDVDYRKETTPVLLVKMVADETVTRLPEAATCLILGKPVSVIEVPQRHEEAAARIVIAWVMDNCPAGQSSCLPIAEA